MKRLTHYLLLIISYLLLGAFHANAQDTVHNCIDVSKITYSQRIAPKASSTLIKKTESLVEKAKGLKLQPGLVHTSTVPPRDVAKKAIIRFAVSNSADSLVNVWFFPGFFFEEIHLYREQPGGLSLIPPVAPQVKDNLGYRQISVNPHDSFVVYAELEFVRTHINIIRPRLIHADRIATFSKDVRADHWDTNVATFLFSGLLLMMILFSMATYFQGGNQEFLYYAGYALFVGGMLFTKAYFDLKPNATGYFLEGYLDYIMQALGIIFYMIFMQRFLSTKTKHPFLFRFYNYGIILLIVSMIVFSYLHYFTLNFAAEYNVENISKALLLVMTIVFLIYSARKWDDRLLRFVFWGNLFLLIFSLLSLYWPFFASLFDLKGLLNSSLFYYEIGLFLELVFFFAGLNYKNRTLIIAQARERERLKTENQMKEYEKELAVYKAQQEERQRISADMHDELGAGMTAIRLMSEIARNKMKESTPVEIERISHSADEVLNKMNAIIWSMNSGNDTLDNLVSYIRSYAIEYLENTSVNCRVNTPPDIAATEITGDKRRNIFLCVKETLNNALKHSNASEIKLDFEINHALVIRISDNGIGIDLKNIRQFGNGLKNIARRMESIGGTCVISNNGGTVTELTLPL